jgi:serine phosphatase RsbU (regulator of sigma subunit)
VQRAGVSDALPEPDFEQLFHLVPSPLVVLMPDFTIVHSNQARLESTATTLEATVGRNLFDVFPANPGDPEADGPATLEASLERARNTRRPDTVPLQKYDIPMPDGSFDERFWSYHTVPVLDEQDQVVLLLHRADDITDYVRYRDDAACDGPRGRRWAEWAQRAEADLFSRTAELAQANAELRALSERERRTAETLSGLSTTVSALSAAESRDDLLRQMFRHGRRALRADVLAVALLEPGGGHLAVVDNRSAAGQEPGRRLSLHSPLPMAAAATGRPVFQDDADRDPAAAAPLPGLRSWAALPLRIGRRPLGSLTVGWERPRVFDDDDVRVLEAFAAQCSQAVHRVARRDTERRQAHATRSLAESLQRSLLTDPPQLAHLDIAVRYRPAAREVQIGGDWYDAFVSPGGDTTLVVGDVTGHDWTAAAVAGQLRNMLRGIASALDHRDPEQVLSALDRALGESGIGTLATAVVARVEEPPATEPDRPRVLRWSNAGHPAPLLLEADGTATLLERPPNLLLGVAPDAARQHHTVALPPGATVVFYTDGLVERRDATLDQGMDRLVAVAHDLAARPVHELCDEILQRLDPDLTDDIALLAVRVRDTGSRASTT